MTATSPIFLRCRTRSPPASRRRSCRPWSAANASAPRASRPTAFDAWECYHRGMWHLAKVEVAENALAQDFFERAIALDPGFAAAQAAMTFAILTAAVLFRPQSERQVSVPRAFDHARRSTALDPSEAVGHCAMAYALTLMGRHDEAMTEADLAVGLDPNFALAHAWKGFTRTFGGRPREAIEPLKTAIRLSPFDPGMPLFSILWVAPIIGWATTRRRWQGRGKSVNPIPISSPPIAHCLPAWDKPGRQRRRSVSWPKRSNGLAGNFSRTFGGTLPRTASKTVST